MKALLEQQSSSVALHNSSEGGEQLPEKGLAKSLLAKWKSIENIKDYNNISSECLNKNTKHSIEFN